MNHATATRRNAEAVLDAIREATRDELNDKGYSGVTFEGVARRAGTSKPVLYRRFPNRAAMVIDAVVTRGISLPPPPLTGPLQADLVALLGEVITRIGPDGSQTFRGVIAEVDNATVDRVKDLIVRSFEAWLEPIFAAARERGELGPSPVPLRVHAAIVALARHEVIFGAGLPTEQDLSSLVDEVIVPLLEVSTRADQPS
ncbi:TetR/AcrR family transcriptional regulator [Demequina sp.]|uniref:TetR/AcrR family transcriptional regulator n=1 Tax=Demequina sp. TaxID=2050685 RepID=UPI0025CC1DA3|nr:TetR/AcrR family transcriptional regulator [Demequina sp.]